MTIMADLTNAEIAEKLKANRLAREALQKAAAAGFNRVTVPIEEREDACSEGLFNVKESMKFLGISQSMLYELMERGYLPYVKIGRARRIPKRVLVQFAAARLVPGRAQGA